MRLKLPLTILALFLSTLLVGCNNHEAKQREAFINFLQQSFLEKKGVRMVAITEDVKNKIGPYFEHFMVINDFHTNMNSNMVNIVSTYDSFAKIQPRNDPADNLAFIAEIKTQLSVISQTMQDELANAQKKKEALHQPADLKSIYDQVFTRNIVNPVTAFVELTNILNSALDEQQVFYSYLNEHKDKVELGNAMIRVTDPALESELNARATKVKSKLGEITEAMRKFNKAIRE